MQYHASVPIIDNPSSNVTNAPFTCEQRLPPLHGNLPLPVPDWLGLNPKHLPVPTQPPKPIHVRVTHPAQTNPTRQQSTQACACTLQVLTPTHLVQQPPTPLQDPQTELKCTRCCHDRLKAPVGTSSSTYAIWHGTVHGITVKTADHSRSNHTQAMRPTRTAHHNNNQTSQVRPRPCTSTRTNCPQGHGQSNIHQGMMTQNCPKNCAKGQSRSTLPNQPSWQQEQPQRPALTAQRCL